MSFIPCSDNCLYQEDGMCVLTHITSSSGEISGHCVYFRSLDRDYDNSFKSKKQP